MDELVDKAKYYMAHQEEARKIADRGFTKAVTSITQQLQEPTEFLSLIDTIFII